MFKIMGGANFVGAHGHKVPSYRMNIKSRATVQ